MTGRNIAFLKMISTFHFLFISTSHFELNIVYIGEKNKTKNEQCMNETININLDFQCDLNVIKNCGVFLNTGCCTPVDCFIHFPSLTRSACVYKREQISEEESVTVTLTDVCISGCCSPQNWRKRAEEIFARCLLLPFLPPLQHIAVDI